LRIAPKGRAHPFRRHLLASESDNKHTNRHTYSAPGQGGRHAEKSGDLFLEQQAIDTTTPAGKFIPQKRTCVVQKPMSACVDLGIDLDLRSAYFV